MSRAKSQWKNLKVQPVDYYRCFATVETIGGKKRFYKQKKLRASEIKVRDLKASREYWKNRALAAEEQIIKQNQSEDEMGKKKKKRPDNPT
jgi:hypothetical protein